MPTAFPAGDVMSVRTLPTPKQLSRELPYQLPRDRFGSEVNIPIVMPLDENGYRCAACKADHYWIRCCYVVTDPEPIPALEEAFKAIPGVYRTTQAYGGKPADPDWPRMPVLASGPDTRPGAWALMRDPEAGPS